MWGGNRNNKHAELICSQVIASWRHIGEQIIHVRHSSTHPHSALHHNSDGFQFNPLCAPLDDEIVITKSVNSCFIGTHLKALLDEKQAETLVIIDLTTDHYISTTTRMASNYGYNSFVISDANATFDRIGVNGEHFDSELIHRSALASLRGEFATILSAVELVKQLS